MAEHIPRALCDDPANALLPFYLNGSLEPGEESAVRAHLALCAVCSREMDELGAFADAAREHGVRVLGPRTASSPRRQPLALALAAAGLIIGLLALGIGWRALSLVGELRPAGQASPAMEMDLGEGPTRGSSGIPTFRTPGRGEPVAVRFSVPPAGRAVWRIQLQGAGGLLFSREDGPLETDPFGRSSFAVPAGRLREPGRYEMIVQRREEDGSWSSYRFPFALESSRAGDQ